MNTTEHLGLKLPEQSDYYDVETQWNYNSQIIDQYAETVDGTLVQIQGAITALSGGVKLKGAVNHYTDLPSSGQQEGDAYTVLYAGTSGTEPLGVEYAWATYDGTPQWVPLGVDPTYYAKAADLATETAARENADTAQTSMLIKLINEGAKNLIWHKKQTQTINGVTLTVNDDLSVTLSTVAGSPCSGYFSFRLIGDQTVAYATDEPIEAGSYVLTGLPASASATTVRYILGLFPSSTGTRTSESIYAEKTLGISGNTARFDLAIYVATNADFSTPVTVYPMLCKKDYHDLTTQYVPGSPSNAELFKMIRSLT